MTATPGAGEYSHGFGTIKVTYPECPDCRSVAKQCRRPSGHGASEWHVSREKLLAELLGWTGWTWRKDYIVSADCKCGCGGGMLLSYRPE